MSPRRGAGRKRVPLGGVSPFLHSAGATLAGDSRGSGRSGYSPVPKRSRTDWITGQIIGGAIDVHRYLGPGMLEHTYEVCLEAALRQRGLQVERQVPVRVRYLDALLFNFNVDALAAGGWKRVLRRG
jgi:hypothetical protein